jgi:hypothetical protein
VFFDYPDSEDDPDSVGQAPPRPAADVFLASASDREWEVLLSHCQRRHFAPAEAVVGPGTTSRSLHLVVNGTLEVLTTAKGVGAKGIGTKGIGAKGVGAKGVGAKRRPRSVPGASSANCPFSMATLHRTSSGPSPPLRWLSSARPISTPWPPWSRA